MGESIPGAVGLWGAGIGGSVSDEFQHRLRSKMLELIGGRQTGLSLRWAGTRNASKGAILPFVWPRSVTQSQLV